MEQKNSQPALQLPIAVVSKVDVGRLIRELDVLDNFLGSAEARQPGAPTQLPKTSRLLDDFFEINKLNALQSDDRTTSSHFLHGVHKDAPTIHFSFSADPAPLFTKRLITWLRQNIHPLVLLQVGLQPTIGAGAVVRTTNMYFDLSLRQRFDESKDVVMRAMRAALKSEGAAPLPTSAIETPDTAPTEVVAAPAVEREVSA